jgi:hypothetical protein
MCKKNGLLLFLLLLSVRVCAQQKIENVLIVTTDGLRWQEVFKGMDSAIANNKKYNEGDSAVIYKHYWDSNESERRKKLFPFLWNEIGTKGELYGNRLYGNKVDNANPYWFSYPGYHEIMTGYVDTEVNSNGYGNNPHKTILEFLNEQPALTGKVAAFASWGAFKGILNETKSGLPVVAGNDDCGGANPSPRERLINEMRKDCYKPWGGAGNFDVFNHYAAKEWLENKHPKVLYVAYNETDDWAHEGKYRSYLDAAHNVDKYVGELWAFVQQNKDYKDKTLLLVTTDHGRGDIVKSTWTDHGNKAASDSHEIWFGIIGPNIKAKGEVKEAMSIRQQQFAQTIAKLLGYTYTADHPIAGPIIEITK